MTVNSVTRTGATTATVNISTVNATAGLKSITMVNPDGQAAAGPPIFRVTVNVAPPVGVIDTPANGVTARGELGITGWAVDDGGLAYVDIMRSPVAGEPPGSLIFLGRASFVRGARPDVAAAFPDMPDNDNAGWGFMVLTNMLPNQGNGTFDLHAIATDLGGAQTLLGTRRIVAANATSTMPFGTIDTPAQGETVSGTIVNFGWALAPLGRQIPINGSTIDVYIDGVLRGHPVYNNVRADIASLFPGLYNTTGGRGAVGYFMHRHHHARERAAHDQLGGARRHRASVRSGQSVLPGTELNAKETGAMASSTTNETVKPFEPQRRAGDRRARAPRGCRGGRCSASARSARPRRRKRRCAPRAGRDRRRCRTARCSCCGGSPTVRRLTTSPGSTSLGYQGYLEWQLNHEVMGDPEARPASRRCRRCRWRRSRSIRRTRRRSSASWRRPRWSARVFTNRQLFERMVEFWADHFTTNIGQVSILKNLEDRDVYRRQRAAARSRRCSTPAPRARRCSST